MGHPYRLHPTNVVPFRQGRHEAKDAQQAPSLQIGNYGVADLGHSLGAAGERYGLIDGYLLVPLRDDDRRAILDTLRRPSGVLTSNIRWLFIGPIFFALLAGLVAVVLWSTGARLTSYPSIEPSSTHGAEAIISLPAIFAPTTLKVTPGTNTAFPISITGTDRLEGVGSVMISRLPMGSTFSAGAPSAETTWAFAPGEIDNLQLMLSSTASDETTLLIQLLTLDGHVISDTATIVEVVGMSKASIPVRRVKTERISAETFERSEPAAEEMDAEAASDLPGPTAEDK